MAFTFSEDLARDLAKYATMVDFWVGELPSCSKTELNIVVIDEDLFKKMFHESYVRGLEGRSEIDGTPIIMSWKDAEGKPHMKLVVNTTILGQPRMQRLFYAMCGILDSVGGLPKPEAAKKANELVGTLE